MKNSNVQMSRHDLFVTYSFTYILRRAHNDGNKGNTANQLTTFYLPVSVLTKAEMGRLHVYFSFCSCQWGETVSELRPLTVLLFIPQMIYESAAPRRNNIGRKKNKELREKPVPVSLCPPYISHGLTKARTRASAMRGQRLTALSMVPPYICITYKTKCFLYYL
jgi:hypothetical protein